MRGRILVVDDEPSIVELVRRVLAAEHDVRGAGSAEEGLELLRDETPDLLVSDLRLPGMDGVELVRRVARRHPALPVVGTSGDAALPELAALMRLGMVDFLVKPFAADELRMAVARAFAWRSLQHADDGAEPEPGAPLEALVGDGRLLTGLRADAARVAASSSPLLIEGPSGSGKTVLARAIHAASSRASEPLVELACAAMPESLLEGELFGHVAGAFTGAVRDRPGAFERARSGTIVLDEITALSRRAQSRLVEAVSQREVTRLGEDRPRPIEARLVATIQRAPEPLLESGELLPELFHGLAVLRLRTPALAELPAEDFERIARLLLQRACDRLGLPPPALEASFFEAASRLRWQGNARELENALERAVLLGDGRPITDADLAGESAASVRSRLALPERGLDLAATLDAIEDDYIRRALERTHGNREKAAALLGMKRTALVQKLKRRDDAR